MSFWQGKIRALLHEIADTMRTRKKKNPLRVSSNGIFCAQDYSHPLALTNLQKNDSKGLDIISFASVNWDVLPCLNVMAQFNYKHGEQITDKYFPKKYSETGVFNDGYGSIDNWKDDNIVFEAYATFDRTFAEKHRLTVMGGYSYENYQSRSSSPGRQGLHQRIAGQREPRRGRFGDLFDRQRLLQDRAGLGPHAYQLHVRQPVPLHLHGPRRRFFEIRLQQQVGLLPLGGVQLEDARGAVHPEPETFSTC